MSADHVQVAAIAMIRSVQGHFILLSIFMFCWFNSDSRFQAALQEGFDLLTDHCLVATTVYIDISMHELSTAPYNCFEYGLYR